MIKQLAHLCFVTQRINAMLRFYRDILGMSLKFTMNGDDGKPAGYYLACGNGTFIEIFDQAGGADKGGGRVSAGGSSAVQYRHLCLEVAGLDEFRTHLQKKNLGVSEIKVGKDNSRQAWVKDPDGNDVELMEYTKDSLQTKP
ncbi:MAG: VOC family protein [Planctomycetes bacterium]|nr:VOC family protein [Planctomycetota bacterium]